MRTRKKRSFLYNCDGEDHLSMVWENPTPEKLIRQIYGPIAQTQVDTICCSMGIGNVALWDSRALGRMGEFTGYQFTNAIFAKAYENATLFLENGWDLLDTVIQGGRQTGVDVFYSYRVNDVHDLWDNCVDVKPLFKKEHPEWLHQPDAFPDKFGAPCTTALDFRRKEVRDNRLAVIREIMEHDFDGLELDLLRDNVYFRPESALSDSYCMTDFIRQVRGLLDRLSEERGRYLELAIRIPHTVVGAQATGFDLATYAREGLVDIVIGGVGGNDGISPNTAQFRALFRDTHIGYYPCLNGWYETADMTLDKTPDSVILGVADQLWADGPDGIYTFNLYPTETYRRDLCRRIGSPETLRGVSKTYVADWAGGPYRKHLPVSLGETETEYFSYSIRTADPHRDPGPSAAELTLKLRDVSVHDVFHVRFNGHSLPPPRFDQEVTQSCLEPVCKWTVQPGWLACENTVEFRLERRDPLLAKLTPLVLQSIHLDVMYSI